MKTSSIRPPVPLASVSFMCFCSAKWFGRLGGFCLGRTAEESWWISATWLHNKGYTRSLSHNSTPLAPTLWVSQLSYSVARGPVRERRKCLLHWDDSMYRSHCNQTNRTFFLRAWELLFGKVSGTVGMCPCYWCAVKGSANKKMKLHISH